MEQIYIQGSRTYILKATSQPSVFSEETGECSKKMKDQYQPKDATKGKNQIFTNSIV